jgi:hypothetical protein
VWAKCGHEPWPVSVQRSLLAVRLDVVLLFGGQLFTGNERGPGIASITPAQSSRLLQPFLYVGTAVHHAPAELERRRAAFSQGAPVPQGARRQPRHLCHVSDGEKFGSLLPCRSCRVRTWRPRRLPCEKAFGDG